VFIVIPNSSVDCSCVRFQFARAWRLLFGLRTPRPIRAWGCLQRICNCDGWISGLRLRVWTDYWIFSPTGHCIAKIGGSVNDFDSLKSAVEFHTRSTKVLLHNWETFQGWQERVNDLGAHWRKSDGPPLIRDRNRRVNIMMVIGCLLIALLVAYTHFYLR